MGRKNPTYMKDLRTPRCLELHVQDEIKNETYDYLIKRTCPISFKDIDDVYLLSVASSIN